MTLIVSLWYHFFPPSISYQQKYLMCGITPKTIVFPIYFLHAIAGRVVCVCVHMACTPGISLVRQAVISGRKKNISIVSHFLKAYQLVPFCLIFLCKTLVINPLKTVLISTHAKVDRLLAHRYINICFYYLKKYGCLFGC